MSRVHQHKQQQRRGYLKVNSCKAMQSAIKQQQHNMTTSNHRLTSFQTGLSVFFFVLVLNFCSTAPCIFTLAYGSLVPPLSSAGSFTPSSTVIFKSPTVGISCIDY